MDRHGPGRLEYAEQIAETLRRTPGIRAKDVFVMELSDEAVGIFYGTYYLRTDPDSGKRAVPKRMQEDLELIKQLGAGPGQHLFLRARKVLVPTPDVGNPDWALSGLDANYSLQVAVFEPTDRFWEYKQAASEYCAELRARGYEAYYHHTDSSSMVTVGAFGPSAVHTAAGGLTYYSEQVTDLQQDELLKYNRLNGKIYKVKDSAGKMTPVPSRLVMIPRSSTDVSW